MGWSLVQSWSSGNRAKEIQGISTHRCWMKVGPQAGRKSHMGNAQREKRRVKEGIINKRDQ